VDINEALPSFFFDAKRADRAGTIFSGGFESGENFFPGHFFLDNKIPTHYT
jgi:hypothetical protein